MGFQLADPSRKVYKANHFSPLVRLRNPVSGEYLHMSGTGSTPNATWAWTGYRYQAKTLRARAKAKGEDWPWRAVVRGAS